VREPEGAVHLGTASIPGRVETLLLSRRGEIALIDFDRGAKLRPLMMDTLQTTNAAVIERHQKAFIVLARLNYGMDYLRDTPHHPPPPGKVLVHNLRQPSEPLGTNGFRAWLINANDRRHARRERCDCGWAPKLGLHYRTSRAAPPRPRPPPATSRPPGSP
jgi:hypothetical protein